MDKKVGKNTCPPYMTEWWDDILGAAHDRAFIVAGAAKADFRGAVEKAIGEGEVYPSL